MKSFQLEHSYRGCHYGIESQLDELWSDVQNKSNQPWLWLAIDHHSRAVLAYTFGKRKDEMFRTFQKTLAPFGITLFYTDDWGSYERNIEAANHKTGKSNTQRIERKNLTENPHQTPCA